MLFGIVHVGIERNAYNRSEEKEHPMGFFALIHMREPLSKALRIVRQRHGTNFPREATVHGLQDALQCWLRWNDAYEHLTERMFEVRHDQAQVEAVAQSVEELRHRAVARSRQQLSACR
jgi:hypothetical protein